MEYSFEERLQALREITHLSLIDSVKLLKCKKEPDVANIEYILRFKTLENSLKKDWQKYVMVENDGLDLAEYSKGVLNDYLKDKSETKQR